MAEYDLYMGTGFPGLIADRQFQNNIVSRSVETAAIIPGLAVSRGTDKENQAVAGGTAPIGIVVRAQDVENNASGELEYAVTDTIGVMTAGSIMVDLVTTGNPGDAIYSIDADGTIGAGTAGAGQTQLNGTLETVVAVAGLATVKLTEQGN